MKLFDAHCHLQDERLKPFLTSVLHRAREAGVAGMLVCGCEEADWPAVRDLAKFYTQIIPAYGLHPWYLAERTPGWRENLVRFLQNDPCAAVGEVGLDHAMGYRNDDEQENVFLQALEIARELQRPVSVHCRQAWASFLRCMERMGPMRPGLVVHSYSGSPELIGSLSRFGIFFSFSGSITYPRNKRGRESVAVVPLERLLIETDAPDIPPRVCWKDGGPFDGTEPLNEPANLVMVVRTIAEIRGMHEEEVARVIWDNSRRVFGHAERIAPGI